MLSDQSESATGLLQLVDCDSFEGMSQIEMVVEELKQLPLEKIEEAAAYVHQLHQTQIEARRRALAETAGCMSPKEADEFLKTLEAGCEMLR